MKKILSLIFLLSACVQSPTVPTGEPSPVVSPTVAAPALDRAAVQKSIADIAATSKCAGYYWKDRGYAPKGYIKGMALSYAKAFCGPKNISSNPIGDASKDALAHYKMSGNDTLLLTYQLAIGLGMRESTGKYCDGVDASATNHTGPEAEAGTFQASFNSSNTGQAFKAIFAKYRADESGCLADLWKEGTKPQCPFATSSYGSGDALEFQKLAKRCPMFTAEYATNLIRVLRAHFGPINRKEVELRAECGDMLAGVKSYVGQSASFCEAVK